MATTIETDLKEVLTKIDSRLEHIESGQADIKVSLARLEEKLDSVDKRVNRIDKYGS
jgi:prefoldin subunit 5